MSIPKEPRQIMINLMYLVLTALLALNVSNEILNAFKTLSGSIDKSNKSIDAKTSEVYAQIKESENEKGQFEKVHKFKLQADDVVKKSDEMVAYLNNWKKRIVVEAGGYDKEDSVFPARMDNIDATTLLLVEKKGGDTIRQKILEMRRYLLSQLDKEDTASYSATMPLTIELAKKNDHNPTGDWNIANFEHMPAIASLALFSKFQNDVRSSENMIIKRLSELAHTKDLKFDTMAALAVPKTTYALQGDKIEATILLAAFNRSNKPTVTITQGLGTKKDAVNGVIPWETIAAGTGLQTVKGRIELEPPGQPKISKEWSFDYMVGTTGASLQLDKMNVFYIGVDNPVTVSAAGYAVEDVFLNLPPGATQSGSNGHFVIKCTTPSTSFPVDIMAKSKVKGGADIKVSTSIIRVKQIPNPIAKLLKKIGGSMQASLFRTAIAPLAEMENFEFDAKFMITQFTFSILPKGGDIVPDQLVKMPAGGKGVRFSDNPFVANTLQAKAKAGDRIFIEQIKAVGPDGKVRDLGSLVFSLY
jgi:gliding motility-associated protein GldM